MDRKLSANRIALAAFAAFAFLALCVADLGALAQNANSSTTQDHTGHNAGAAPSQGRRARRRNRRQRRRAAAATAAAATDATATDATATDTSMAATDASQERTDGGEQTDLSGTYMGRLTMTGGQDMAGEATLTITGNTFTLAASGGATHTGRVLAVTTRGYTGASFYFTDVQDPTTSTPVVAATRARRQGNRLTLTPVPGARTRMTFNGRSS